MATSDLDHEQLARFVAWLDEERQRALAQIGRLTNQVEILSNADGVRGQSVAVVENEVRRVRGLEQRLLYIEQAAREAFEPIADLRLRLEALERAVEQQAAVRDVAVERLQRHAGDLAQATDALRMSGVELAERMAGVAEEARRDRGLMSEVVTRIDEMRQKLLAVDGRLSLAEEELRRSAQGAANVEQQLSTLVHQQERERELHQLHQLQVQRTFREWEERASEWQRLLSDAHAAARSAREQAFLAAAEVTELRALAQRNAEGLAAQEEAVSAWRAQQTTFGSQLAATRADAQSDKERLQELAAVATALGERLDQAIAGAQDVHRQQDALREGVERVHGVLARLERQLVDVDEQRRATARELRADVEQTRAVVAGVEREMAALGQRLQQRLGELQELEEQHRQRQISELEQQVREFQARVRTT